MLSYRLQRWHEGIFYDTDCARRMISMIKCRGQDYFLEGNEGEKINEHRITFAPNSCFII